MAASVYDNITALIFACLLFVSAVVAVPAIGYVNLLYVDQQQLRNVALEALNSMLLSMGYPSNWGSSSPFEENALEIFGLALSESSSFYVLDPDKVQRLAANNPTGHLSYADVHDLLNLQGYGFNMRIMPLFSVEVKNESIGNFLSFLVTVTSNQGGPIPGASVGGTILYVLETQGKDKTGFSFTPLPETKTNATGECTISHTLLEGTIGYILVLKVTVAEMAMVTVPYLKGFAQNVANVSIIDDFVHVTIPQEGNPSARRIYNVVGVSGDKTVEWYNNPDNNDNDNLLNDPPASPFGYWPQEPKRFAGFSYEYMPFLIFNLMVTLPGQGGRQEVLFAASPFLDLASGGLQLGPASGQSASNAVRLSRFIEIGGMTYILEFLLWKGT